MKTETTEQRISDIWTGLRWQDAREASARHDAIVEDCQLEFEVTDDPRWLKLRRAATAAYNAGCPVYAAC